MKSRIWACALAVAAACVAATALATTAGATSLEVAYDNLNTVPAEVNGSADLDTYSQDLEGFPFGGMIETVDTNSRLIKTLSAQLDVFACEHGEYQLENCYTIHSGKKFAQEWSADVYEVGAGDTLGALVASSTAKFRLPYRPTTNVSCPSTPEGKGFGPNCDVGGYLVNVKFKRFTQSRPLPVRAIVLLSTSSPIPVNVGLQAAYKEYRGGEYIEEPAADGGVPAIGADPLPEGVFFKSTLQETGWTGFQPVFELTVR